MFNAWPRCLAVRRRRCGRFCEAGSERVSTLGAWSERCRRNSTQGPQRFSRRPQREFTSAFLCASLRVLCVKKSSPDVTMLGDSTAKWQRRPGGTGNGQERHIPASDALVIGFHFLCAFAPLRLGVKNTSAWIRLKRCHRSGNSSKLPGGYERICPALSGWPARKSAALMRRPPSRCKAVTRSAS